MSGSKFNSTEVLNKTPGVCHSARAEPPPPDDPPAEGTFPGYFNINANFIADLGFGFEDFSVKNQRLHAVTVGVFYRQVFFLPNNRVTQVNVSLTVLTNNFAVGFLGFIGSPPPVANPGGQTSDIPISTPMEVIDFKLDKPANVQVATLDFWS